jgi:hypothetical protein
MVSTRRLAITAQSQPPDCQPNHLDGNSFAALAELDEVMQDAPTPPQSPTDPAAHTSLVEFVPCEEPRTLQLTTLPENTLTTLEDLPDLPSLDVATVASLPDFTGLDLSLPYSHAFSTEDTQRQLAHISDTTDARFTSFAHFISSSLHAANTVFIDLRDKVTSTCSKFHTDLVTVTEEHNKATATFSEGFKKVAVATQSLHAAAVANRSGVQSAHSRIHTLHGAAEELWTAAT